ncbi:MAG TPA: CheR family methyltransferase [Candidatus Gastranaerophilales bacterium]|nr:CheR family methyltransferase [Candidatus Gastranaerophilales bacterium]
MNISLVNPYPNYNTHKTNSFKANKEISFRSTFDKTERNTLKFNDEGVDWSYLINLTHFFRDAEVFTNPLVKYLKTEFPDGVKIYNYACSDGSEPYSLSIKLMNKLGEKKAQKYFPIIARDLSKKQIDQAQKREINIDDSDKEKIYSNTSFLDLNELFNYRRTNDVGENYYSVKKKLADCVNFEQANLVLDAKNPENFTGNKKGPSVLIFRWAFYHLSDNAKKELFESLANNPSFEPGSVIILEPDCLGRLVSLDKQQIPLDKFIPLDKNFKEVNDKSPHSYYMFKKRSDSKNAVESQKTIHSAGQYFLKLLNPLIPQKQD